MEYSARVRRLFEELPASGVPEAADGVLVSGRAGSIETGACIEFHLAVSAGRVLDAGFNAYGCPHTIAIAAHVATGLPGRLLGEIGKLDLGAVATELELPADKLGRVLVAEDALAACAGSVEVPEQGV